MEEDQKKVVKLTEEEKRIMKEYITEKFKKKLSEKLWEKINEKTKT